MRNIVFSYTIAITPPPNVVLHYPLLLSPSLKQVTRAFSCHQNVFNLEISSSFILFLGRFYSIHILLFTVILFLCLCRVRQMCTFLIDVLDSLPFRSLYSRCSCCKRLSDKESVCLLHRHFSSVI